MKPEWPTPSLRPTCFTRIACCWPARNSSPSKGFFKIRTTSSLSKPNECFRSSSPKPKQFRTTSTETIHHGVKEARKNKKRENLRPLNQQSKIHHNNSPCLRASVVNTLHHFPV